MFGDGEFVTDRTDDQMDRFQQWIKSQKGVDFDNVLDHLINNFLIGRKMTIIEIGAGTAIPTARILSESVAADNSDLR